ncbi:AraC family transcriptional regulator [uncultured Martelella sp.]|uniref:AraC family transcriptional regulator n=1 Tax=uncultured Martelella sp. TaxID=392331 RepID=UPI0029C7D4EC|nr:AraC family transcriptional regulator [uncultured Martelella sp.]
MTNHTQNGPQAMSDDKFRALCDIVERHIAGREDRETPVPNLALFRRETTTEPVSCRVEPCIVFVLQGAKQMLIGDREYRYGADRFLIASLDLPGSSQVLEASPDKPCLGMVMRLDLRMIAELSAQVSVPTARAGADAGAAVGTMTPGLEEAFGRLLSLVDEPEAIDVLAPLIEREIHYRLLRTDVAERLLRIVSVGSQGQRIARAVDWLKTNYARPLRVEDLAAHVQMSPSSLHHHFRHLTAMSPLQYQKWLRLNEARRLMLNAHLDAAGAAFHVGYESPSQFSREYSRLFGAPPKRDIEGLAGKALPSMATV